MAGPRESKEPKELPEYDVDILIWFHAVELEQMEAHNTRLKSMPFALESDRQVQSTVFDCNACRETANTNTYMTKQTRFFRTCVGVFQGGGCRGAALAGAYQEATARGVTFAEVAGTSAGSIVAALIGAGATPEHVSNVLVNLSFTSLLTPPEALCNRPLFAHLLSWLPGLGLALDLYYDRGLYSAKGIETWVEDRLRELLPRASRPAVTFEDLIIPTSIIVTDTLAQKVEVRKQGTHDKASVAQAVRASCSIPLFFQPLDNRYVDGGVLSNLPSFVFSEHSLRDQPLATRILAFTLSPATQASSSTASLDFFRHIADTVVEGSQDLQLAQQHDVHVISIPTYDVKATDFGKMDQATIKKLVESGKAAAASFFDDELNQVRTPRPAATLCYGLEEVYSAVTEKIDRVDEVLIAEESTKFVYSLFPTLLRWRSSGVKVKTLLLKLASAKPDESYRRRLLRALGVQVCEVESVPVRVYLFNSSDPLQASAIVGVPQTGGTQIVEAVRYEGKIDSAVIQAVAEQVNHAWTSSDNPACHADRPKLVECGWDLLEAGFETRGTVLQSGGKAESTRGAIEVIGLTNAFCPWVQIYPNPLSGRYVSNE